MRKVFAFTLFLFLFQLAAVSCSPSLKIAEYAVTEKSTFVNLNVESLPLKNYDVKLLRLKRNGQYVNFNDKTKIQLRDTLYLLGTSNQLEKVYRYFDKKD